MDIKLEKISECKWRIPKTGGMNVDGIIYTNEKLLKDIEKDDSLKQVVNVAMLPGIIKYSLAMPDIHSGYGFSIGGVAAFDCDHGIISPGGVGYDINCGVRLLRSNLIYEDVKDKIKDLVTGFLNGIPSGVGSSGAIRKLNKDELKKLCKNGAKWAVENGFGSADDLKTIEDGGIFPDANPDMVSSRAFERGLDQVGTLGSGNHFLEIDLVEEIFDENVGCAFGLEKGMIVILIHTGSRGFGYQICDDYLRRFSQEYKSFGINIPDRQLSCAPVKSQVGMDYFSAMACGVNYAWANRQVITHLTRRIFEKLLHQDPKSLGLSLVYDVAHNIAKIEEHIVDGKKVKVCVHRKGATRAFPAGHNLVPEIYRDVGQPVLIPGDMGRNSFVLVGTDLALQETFGSTCHGAGRVLSRTAALKEAKGRRIDKELEEKGIIVMSSERSTLAEEMPSAYKNVSDVVEVVTMAGISKKVAKLKPLGVIKG
ncbi:MAG: RtcB family protein [Candidatus Firestonebacteria bacterium]